MKYIELFSFMENVSLLRAFRRLCHPILPYMYIAQKNAKKICCSIFQLQYYILCILRYKSSKFMLWLSRFVQCCGSYTILTYHIETYT